MRGVEVVNMIAKARVKMSDGVGAGVPGSNYRP